MAKETYKDLEIWHKETKKFKKTSFDEALVKDDAILKDGVSLNSSSNLNTKEEDNNLVFSNQKTGYFFNNAFNNVMQRKYEDSQINFTEKYHKPPFIKDGFDKKTLKNIKNHKITIDGVLDLHGFKAEEAQRLFIKFVINNYQNSKRYLLIITGKGNRSAEESIEVSKNHQNNLINKGILYQSFFSWIMLNEVKPFIVSYSKANLNHGGSGAFYVCLRKKQT